MTHANETKHGTRKDHHSFSANRSAVGSSPRFAPLFWLVARPVFEQVQAITVMRVWVCEAFPAPPVSTAVYPPSGINETLPRVMLFSNDHFSFFLPGSATKQPGSLL